MLRTAKRAVLKAVHAAGYDIVKRGPPTRPARPSAPEPSAPERSAPETSEVDRLFAPSLPYSDFVAEMQRYEATLAPRRTADPQFILDSLFEDGVCFVPNFLPPDALTRLHDEVLAVAREVRAGTFKEQNRHVVYPQYGFLRLNNPENVTPGAAQFFNDPRISNVVEAYLAGHGRRMEKYIDYKFDNRPDANLLPHTDNIYRMVKVFLYLNDIPDTHAPLTYWKKSHLKRPWRKIPDYLHYAEHPYGRFGSVPSNVYYDLGTGEHADIVKTECVAKAGTAIFCDVSGLHSASLLRDGYRLMFVDNWMAQENGKWLNPYHGKATSPNGFV